MNTLEMLTILNALQTKYRNQFSTDELKDLTRMRDVLKKRFNAGRPEGSKNKSKKGELGIDN